MRNFLIGHDELPDAPLVVTIPVAVGEKDSQRESGNRIATFVTLLHLNTEDPIERYRAIQESTRQGKV